LSVAAGERGVKPVEFFPSGQSESPVGAGRARPVDYSPLTRAHEGADGPLKPPADVSSDARAGPMVEIQQVGDKEPSDG